ncbi:ParB N-terminal domain-containing protein [Vibrio europaeus]|uniref:ParB N-terminal domain-containing protein n=1 Tax=Vibrio europaeus TaxID=300876 RepID=UPI00233F6CC3|nr:ParB N-terminal domain-containing protein [Vibrio europaeus]MDC5758031.1 ParB N-terminal domain-containing protein [Vibrio europaeus]MDC5773575.1 ParB N-terminal domain-containing protein [Vibrio europaeus]MDC5793211.1 ParB N-terminal domain-containing protein [Vibrio europaeus]MDC5802724.1 ParB N-terminal domain-containing protein [Vibrio europaeus]MDC5814632.1 ParB N-terminal domain-containing protein [Vibrio europaeus]
MKYKKVNRSVKSIDLDLNNPRLAGIVRRQAITNQKEALKALAKRHEIYGLCNSILNNGFHPDEVLIAVQDEKQNRVTVIEGNRRLSACKILQKPDCLKGEPEYTKFKKLKKHDNYEQALESIKRLTVVILDSRHEAASYIASKHTSESIKRWSPYTQGAYLYGFLTEFKNIDNVVTILKNSTTKSEIKKRWLHYLLTETILNLECWNEKDQDYLIDNIDKLNVGAIIRFISRSRFINEVCDVKVSDTGSLVVTSKDTSEIFITGDIFNQILEKLSRDALLANKLNTRQENEKEMNKYLDEIIEMFKPQSSDSNNEELVIGGGKPEGESSPQTPPTPPEPGPTPPDKPRRTVERLLPPEMQHPLANVKLAKLCEEAKRINYKQHRYSSALMIRAIIEVSLRLLIMRSPLKDSLKQQYRDKAFDFANMLKFAEQNTKDLVEKEHVRVFRSGIADLLQHSKELLNLTNHDDTQHLSEKEVDHLRAKMLDVCTAMFAILNKHGNTCAVA